MKKLLFVDTNIYLDFYRVRTEAGLALLHHLDSIKDKIIITSQVEMEFKKHRQATILETLKSLKPVEQIARPGIFSDDKSMKALQANVKKSEKRVKSLTARLRRVLEKPTVYDPVYKVAQRIFTKADNLNLTRDDKIKSRTRAKAMRRFLFGYPPRKKNDTSMGDAFNWEWIIEVAARENANIYIVSRDSDYGDRLGNQCFLNDWLQQEYRVLLTM